MQNVLSYVVARRRLLTNVCLLTLLLLLSRRNATCTRSCRRLGRNLGWFNLVWTTYSDERFKKTFRVSRGTFNLILARIWHVLERDTVSEEPISPECRLALCLYRLGRGDYYYTVAEMAGLGVSTVCTVCNEVAKAIVDNMWEECVTRHMPKSEEDFRKKILDMEELWQFPCSWSAVDGCHIPIKCPAGGPESCKEYHNFKNFYSVVLMAMVDANYRFVWASCGFPGNSHDAIIFQSTDLWMNIKENNLIPQIGKDVGGVIVPPLILSDSAFPFQPWLMKPYTNAVLTPKQRNFNYRLSRARMVVEGCYGQLKGRWRVLQRKCESHKDQMKTATLACIVLHNLCIDHGDTIPRKLDLTIDPITNQRRARAKIQELLHMTSCEKIKDSSHQATLVREALAEKLWQEKQGSML